MREREAATMGVWILDGWRPLLARVCGFWRTTDGMPEPQPEPPNVHHSRELAVKAEREVSEPWAVLFAFKNRWRFRVDADHRQEDRLGRHMLYEYPTR